MNTRTSFKLLLGRCARGGMLLALLALALPWAARAQTVQGSGSFVDSALTMVVDSRVDPASQKHFVLSGDGVGNAYLRVYDSTGSGANFVAYTNQIVSVTNGVGVSATVSLETNVVVFYITNQVTLPGLNPASLAVGANAGTTNLYLVGGTKIYKVDGSSGTILKTLDAGSASGLSLKGVFCTAGGVYACGNLAGGSTTIFGKTATLRGQSSGVVMELTTNLASTAVGLIVYGANGSGAINTANSLAVDENGDIYVAGRIGNGTFDSDVFKSGQFNAYTKMAGYAVGNLADATRVVNDTGITPNVIANQSTINYNNGTANYIFRATGIFNAPAPGTYTFYNTTDDGSWLYVDGTFNGGGIQVINDSSTHGATAFSNTIGLSSGFHSIDFLYFNAGGPGSGTLTFTGPGVPTQTAVPAADLGSNKGCILKFAGDFTALKGCYSSEVTGGDGELYEVTYAQGFVYGIGYFQGPATNSMISPPDSSEAGMKNIEVLKLDTGLLLKARATAKSAVPNKGYSLTVDEAGNVYIAGSMGPQSMDFFGNSDPTNAPSKSIGSAKASIFAAKLNSSLDYQWVTTPTAPVPDFDFSITTPRVRWATSLQRLYWTGYFKNNQLVMGNPNTSQTLNGPESFVALLDPDGTFTERVLLTIFS
ncbi:MAG TPA: PA14 domain-containing protein, partial [Verrucomicrobiae bacterium]